MVLQLDYKLYPLPPKDNKALQKWLKEEEEKGYIRLSISPIASPFFFLQKANGSQRPVQDYRSVNWWTVCNWYPLPLIPELIAEVQKAFVFTKFDIEGGFNKVQMLQMNPHFFLFYFASGTYQSCDTYHVISCDQLCDPLSKWLYCPCDVHCSPMFHLHQFHLFIGHHYSSDLLFSVTLLLLWRLLFVLLYCSSLL